MSSAASMALLEIYPHNVTQESRGLLFHCILKYLLSGVTTEREERVYMGGLRPKFPSTVCPANMSFSRTASHSLSEISSTKAEKSITVLLCDQEERHGIEIGNTDSIVSAMLLKDLFWETQKEARGLTFCQVRAGSQGDTGQSCRAK